MLYQSASAMTADRATASATGLFSEPERDVNNVVRYADLNGFLHFIEVGFL